LIKCAKALGCFRPQATQSFIGQYATQVVTFPRLDHPPQHPLSSGNICQHSVSYVSSKYAVEVFFYIWLRKVYMKLLHLSF